MSDRELELAQRIMRDQEHFRPETVAKAREVVMAEVARRGGSAPKDPDPYRPPLGVSPAMQDKTTMFLPFVKNEAGEDVPADVGGRAIYDDPSPFATYGEKQAGRAHAVARSIESGQPAVFLEGREAEGASDSAMLAAEKVASRAPAMVRGLGSAATLGLGNMLSDATIYALEQSGAIPQGTLSRMREEESQHPGTTLAGAGVGAVLGFGAGAKGAGSHLFAPTATVKETAKQAAAGGAIGLSTSAASRGLAGEDAAPSGMELGLAGLGGMLPVGLSALRGASRGGANLLERSPAVRAATEAERTGVSVGPFGGIDESTLDPDVLRAMKHPDRPNANTSETLAGELAADPKIGGVAKRLVAQESRLGGLGDLADQPRPIDLAPTDVREASAISSGRAPAEALGLEGASRSIPRVTSSLMTQTGRPLRTSIDAAEVEVARSAIGSDLPEELQSAFIDLVRAGAPRAESATAVRKIAAEQGVDEALRVVRSEIAARLDEVAGPYAASVQKSFEDAGGVPSTATRIASEAAVDPVGKHLLAEHAGAVGRSSARLNEVADELISTEGLAEAIAALRDRHLGGISGVAAGRASYLGKALGRLELPGPVHADTGNAPTRPLSVRELEQTIREENARIDPSTFDPSNPGDPEYVKSLVATRPKHVADIQRENAADLGAAKGRLELFGLPTDMAVMPEEKSLPLIRQPLERTLVRVSTEMPAGGFTPREAEELLAAIRENPQAADALRAALATGRVAKEDAPEIARTILGISGPGSLGAPVGRSTKNVDAAYRAILGSPDAPPGAAESLSRALPVEVGSQRALKRAGEARSPVAEALGYDVGKRAPERLSEAREGLSKYAAGSPEKRAEISEFVGPDAAATLRAAGAAERAASKSEKLFGFNRTSPEAVKSERVAAHVSERFRDAPVSVARREVDRFATLFGTDPRKTTPEQLRESTRKRLLEMANGSQRMREDLSAFLEDHGLGDYVSKLVQAGAVDELTASSEQAAGALTMVIGSMARRIAKGAPIATHRALRGAADVAGQAAETTKPIGRLSAERDRGGKQR